MALPQNNCAHRTVCRYAIESNTSTCRSCSFKRLRTPLILYVPYHFGCFEPSVLVVLLHFLFVHLGLVSTPIPICCRQKVLLFALHCERAAEPKRNGRQAKRQKGGHKVQANCSIYHLHLSQRQMRLRTMPERRDVNVLRYILYMRRIIFRI